MTYWYVTWALLAANLGVGLWHLLHVKPTTRHEMEKLETRLKESAQVRKVFGKTYQERLQEEYRKRGISG